MQIKDLLPWNWGRPEAIGPHREDDRLQAVQTQVNQAFQALWNTLESSPLARGLGADPGPRVEVVETDTAIEVSAELPGMEERDIDVALTEDLLTIKGEKRSEREDQAGGFLVRERSYGAFQRVIALPAAVDSDKVAARFRNGVLTVTLPKTEAARAEVKRVTVKKG